MVTEELHLIQYDSFLNEGGAGRLGWGESAATKAKIDSIFFTITSLYWSYVTHFTWIYHHSKLLHVPCL